MLHLLKQEFIFIERDFSIVPKPRKKLEKIIKTFIDDIEYYNCNYCHETKLRDQYTKYICDGCKKCIALYDKQKRDTPRGALKQLLNGSRWNTKLRDQKNNKKLDNTYDIDFEFLVELYNKQKGLCAYSGLPLQFKANNDWTISLERIDTFKGYIKTNICLICWEFNTPDKSITYKNNDSGNAGWNKEKFALFLEKATEKYCK